MLFSEHETANGGLLGRNLNKVCKEFCPQSEYKISLFLTPYYIFPLYQLAQISFIRIEQKIDTNCDTFVLATFWAVPEDSS